MKNWQFILAVIVLVLQQIYFWTLTNVNVIEVLFTFLCIYAIGFHMYKKGRADTSRPIEIGGKT